MFETLKPTPPDKIIELMGLYQADPRTDKLDLGVGVYKDAAGRTPVMRAVKAAEARLLEEQETKSLRRHPRRSRSSSTRWPTSPSATRSRASGSPAPRPRAAPARSASSAS